MRSITATRLDELAKAAGIKQRLRKELRFSPASVEHWDELEYLVVYDRSMDKGILVIEIKNNLYLTPFEVLRRLSDQTGRSKPIICDLCYTWNSGSNAGRLIVTRKSDQHVISYLCCADLRCSDHVRTKTAVAQRSRAQLHEDLSSAQRVDRLKRKLQSLVNNLTLEPIDAS